MEFSPVGLSLIIVGALAVIVGIRGSNKAVFQTLTGHTTTGAVATETAGPLVSGNPMTIPGSGEVGVARIP